MTPTPDQIWEMARTAFGERGAETWMRGQNWHFGSHPPVSALATPEGRDRLYDLLCSVTLKIHVDGFNAVVA